MRQSLQFCYIHVFLERYFELIGDINCTVIAVDAKEHMHRRQMLAGMLVSNTRLVMRC